MPAPLIHVADRIFNRPLLIHPIKAEVILAALQDRLALAIELPDPAETHGAGINRFMGSAARKTRKEGMSAAVGSTAIITIDGTLVNRGAWLGTYSGMVSYEGIAGQLRDAAQDPEIDSILLDIETPGGEAAGITGLATLVREIRKTKRVVAFVDDMAASGGYWLASQADEIVVSQTSIVGSIGVIMLHIDRAEQYAKAGVKPTLIFAGAHKVDGHPFGPLPEGVAADLQREVDDLYQTFVDQIALGRGDRLNAANARATQARVFNGTEAIRLGLADRMASLDQVLAELSARATGMSGRASTKRAGVTNMPAPEAAVEPAGITKEQHDVAVKAARDEGHTAGVKDERDRSTAILTCEEAKGREGQAIAMVTTGATAEQAKAMLAASPKHSSIASRSATGADLGGGQVEDTNKPAAAMWGSHIDGHNKRIAAGRR